ncbi:RSP_7527 family protein [Rhodoferax sp.]|uniref:RSP_7527 family protein n=1 Tax=Rhodoferax sp. TaxID=50421 RepID=UPI0026200C2F|nr:hypothetical protein [Rhodoferax sp.]MDD2918551.1 hypothetical protein [Rhodoferax sp.]
MEYQYSDIEAHIRQAQKLRSEALGEFLSAGWNTCMTWFKHHAQRLLHKHIVAARSTAAAIY